MHLALKRPFFALCAAAACGGAAFAACSESSSEQAPGIETDAGAGGGSAGVGGWVSVGGSGGIGGGTAADGAGGQSGPPGAEWEPVTPAEFTQPTCWLYQAKPGTLSFPPLEWQSCGADCEWLDPTRGSPDGYASAGAASVDSNTAYVRLTVANKDRVPWTDRVTHVVRLQDGATVAALWERDGSASTCVLSFDQQTAISTSFANGGTILFGYASPPAGGWVWAEPATSLGSLPPMLSLFDIRSSWFAAGKGGLYALHTPTSSTWTTLEAPSDAMRGGGEGDLALWTEWSSDRIRGWTADGSGVRTIVQSAPSKTCLIRPSADHIVGVALDPDCATGKASGVRFWHAPRTATSTSDITQLKPIASEGHFPPGFGLRTFGDYAGAIAYDEIIKPVGYLIVVQLSTGKAWRVAAEPGFAVQDGTWAFDGTWLYYGETPPGVAHVYEVHRMRRIRLSALDTLAEPL